MTRSLGSDSLTDAFDAGAAAFKRGDALESNPHSDGSERSCLQTQWRRGFVNTRQRARFDATIAARSNNEGGSA